MPLKYFEKNEEYHEVAGAYGLAGSRSILNIAERRRVVERNNVENNPKRSDKLSEDINYKLGFIGGLNFILNLPEKAQTYLNKLSKVKGDENED